MGMLRSISRKAHPEAWAIRTRFNRLRRLTQQAMRAQGRNDVGTMARIADILVRLGEADVFEPITANQPSTAEAPFLVQKEESDDED